MSSERLVIRREQLELLGADRTESFVAQAMEAVSIHWPGAFRKLGREGCEQRVRRAMDAARRFGISLDVDVLRFLNLTFALGEDFYVPPAGAWAVRILERSELSPALRLQMLMDRARTILEERP